MTPAEVDTERAQAAQGDSDGSMRLRAESPSDSPEAAERPAAVSPVAAALSTASRCEWRSADWQSGRSPGLPAQLHSHLSMMAGRS